MRYIIADPDAGRGWGHIFSEYDTEKDRSVERERTVRFVYDTESEALIHLEIMHQGKYELASRAELDDVQESLKDANSDILDDPEGDLLTSDELPVWARPTLTPGKLHL